MPPNFLKFERETGGDKRETGPAKKKESTVNIIIIMSVLFIAVAGTLGVSYSTLGTEVYPFYQSVFSRNWLKTEGKVVKTFISTDSAGKEGRTIYIPNVVYSFSGAEREYLGDRINFSAKAKAFGSQKDCDNFLNAYRDKTVEIFYDPNNPQESTLSREYIYKSSDLQGGCCCGSIGLVFALVFCLVLADLLGKTGKK